MELDRRILALLIALITCCAATPANGQNDNPVDSTSARDLMGPVSDAFDADLAADHLGILLTHPDSVRAHMPEAVQLYVNLLYNADLVGTEARETIVTTLLAAFSVVAPEEIVDELISGSGRQDAKRPSDAVPIANAGAGPKLVAWWRSRDPFPATVSNELLEEHLIRLAHVLDAFRIEKAKAFDMRGQIWLRYGAPSRAIEVEFSDPLLTDIVFRPGVAVSPSEFPRNEFWVYGHIDRAAYFLFVDVGDGFRLGETYDLIPRSLRSGFSSQQRGRIKSGMAIAVMQNIYRQLATLHSDFAMRYAEVDQYAMRLPEFTTGRLAARLGRPLATAPENIDDGSTGVSTPGVFASTMLVRTQTEDAEADALREEVVPNTVSASEHVRPDLSVAYRLIRRLLDSGQTAIEIYWAPKPGGLGVDDEVREIVDIGDPDVFRLDFTCVLKGRFHTTRMIQTNRVMVEGTPEGSGEEGAPVWSYPVPTQVMQIIPIDDLRKARSEDAGRDPVSVRPPTRARNELHLALQWDQYAMNEAGEDADTRKLLRTHTELVDSVEALGADEMILEMSDLLPLVSDLEADEIDSEANPYPFDVLSGRRRLALSFDIYHLVYNAEDRTQYQIRFIVERGTMKDGRFSPSGGRDSGTSTAFNRSGESRKTREEIQIDLGDLSEPGHLEITVEVTDRLDGRTASRKILFEVQR